MTKRTVKQQPRRTKRSAEKPAANPGRAKNKAKRIQHGVTFGELLAERGELAPPKEGKAKTGTPITRAARRAGITERDANPEKPKELRTKADFEAAADRIVDVVLGGDLPALPFFREVMLERLAERFGKEAEGTRSPEELERRHDRREERLASVSRLLSGGLWVSDDDSDPAELALLHVAAAQIKAVMLAMTTSDGIGADGWALDHDEMTDADIQAALSGVVATLQAAPKLLAELRGKGEWRDSVERPERSQAREFKAQGEQVAS